jgi:hypothetical protein
MLSVTGRGYCGIDIYMVAELCIDMRTNGYVCIGDRLKLSISLQIAIPRCGRDLGGIGNTAS